MGVENINAIANALASHGGSKESIIAVICNMMGETGCDPMIHEYGKENFGYYPASMGWRYSHGVGLVQMSYLPDNKEIAEYNKTHTVAESIVFQCAKLFKVPVQSWQDVTAARDGGGVNYNGINEFWKNSKGRTVRQLAGDWYDHFERGDTTAYGYPNYYYMSAGQHRYDLFINTVNANVKWDGSTVPSGGGDAGEEKPRRENKRLMNLQECLSFIDKARPPRKKSDDPINPDTPPIQPSGSKNVQNVYNMYNEGVNANCLYAWSERAQYPKFSDCSSFVTIAVCTWLGKQVPHQLPNTDGLHGWLKSMGYHFVKAEHPMTGPFKEGDVIIMGIPGSSGGSAGHTVFITDSSGTTLESTGENGFYTPCLRKRTVSFQNGWITGLNYWALYRYG